MVVHLKSAFVIAIVILINISFAQIVIPDFAVRGDVPDSLYQDFMTNLRIAVAQKTNTAVTVGEFVSSGMASSLDPRFTKIIAQNEAAQFALSGEIRQTYGDPLSISLLIADANSDRHSDIITKQFGADSINLLVDLLSNEIAQFVAPINNLLVGDAGLFIATEPAGAKILINGLEIGTSPIVDVLMLEPKTYTVELRKQGFLAEKRQVELKSGITELLNLELTPINGGTIQVDSQPSAKIMLDGRDIGFTPKSFQALPGEHNLELIRLGFKFVALTVSVREFRVTISEQKLKPISNFMLFWDLVDKQLVYIDGKLQIKPFLLEPGAGVHQVELRSAGKSTKFEISMAATGVYYLDFAKQMAVVYQ
ncbi:MAG TPA: PEGA domain-containing protein [Trueperaceae bacterium]|nr:PEGA domain-containing protein [Trueperaceae bacterium]